MVMIIHISGPPASGKSTLGRILLHLYSKKNIEVLYTFMTGFHYLSYAYGMLLLILIYSLKGKHRCKVLSQVKVHKRNPYDLIPTYLLKKHLFLIYMLEVLNICVKVLITRLRISLQKPKIVLIDEAIVNTAFYYIQFFSAKKSMLWKPMLRYFLSLSRLICGDCLIIVLLLNEDEELKLWSKRGDLPSLHVAKRHIKVYKRVLRPLLKLIHHFTGARVYVFSSNIEALRFTIKHLGCTL